MACTNCTAWFHYEDGTTDGLWVVGLVGSCDDIRTKVGGAVTYFGFAFPRPNVNAQFIWITDNEAPFPVSLAGLAQDLYTGAQTKLSADGPPADDYQVVCSDAAPTSGPCPPGTYFDDATETCQPLAGVIRIPTVVRVTPTPVIIPTPKKPPPPPPPPPPPLEQGQPEFDGDEITQTLCAQMQADTLLIVDTLQRLIPISGGAPSDTEACCANLVTAIGGISVTLTGILNLLFQKLDKPIANLDPVTCSQLTALVNQLDTTLKGTAPLDNPTPPTPPAFTAPAPYTLQNAADNIQAAILVLPNLAQ